MNIVLIPCWRRDDFLAVTLQHIAEADGADNHLYVFLLDRGFDLTVSKVVNDFPLNKIVHKTRMHRFHGNTFNVMEGYKYALTELVGANKTDLVYLIEEDIWVGKDFFTFHESVQNSYSPFVLSGVLNQNNPNPLPEDPKLVYYHPKFQSLGLSWKPENLAKVVEHSSLLYYVDMPNYLVKHFPDSSFGKTWTEQDGLINRLCEQKNYQCMYPYVGRAYHAGFVGYNRPGTFLTGSFEERVNKLKTMSAYDMNRKAQLHKDIKPCSLDGHDVQQFEAKQP